MPLHQPPRTHSTRILKPPTHHGTAGYSRKLISPYHYLSLPPPSAYRYQATRTTHDQHPPASVPPTPSPSDSPCTTTNKGIYNGTNLIGQDAPPSPLTRTHPSSLPETPPPQAPHSHQSPVICHCPGTTGTPTPHPRPSMDSCLRHPTTPSPSDRTTPPQILRPTPYHPPMYGQCKYVMCCAGGSWSTGGVEPRCTDCAVPPDDLVAGPKHQIGPMTFPPRIEAFRCGGGEPRCTDWPVPPDDLVAGPKHQIGPMTFPPRIGGLPLWRRGTSLYRLGSAC
eukprot:GHVO01070578.1.p1 GENE.GHVO01070578.1~~GHVO01070578.1.p1  ORF type:complete len:280 (-),score=14.82 GHVO01070578.1:14-853(-)